MYEELTFNDSGLPNEIASASAAQNLYKALTAGDSADPGSMGTSGNTLQFESLEPQLVAALKERPEDFKLMALQKKRKVGSPVHQYTQEQDSGDFEGIGTAELGNPIESDSTFERITRNLRYFQTKRDVSLQAMMLNPTIGGAAEATEERHGAHVLLKGTEYYCFHGNNPASPNLPDGYPQMIRNEGGVVTDMLGLKVSEAGAKDKLDNSIRLVYENGGEISDMFFPPIIAKDFMDLLEDRMRYNDSSRIVGEKLISYQTSYGKDVWISGRAGVDKLYRVKSAPTPSSLTALRPTAPTFALLAQAKTGGTGFIASTAGTYRYTVYAVDASGLISAAATPANVVVAAGQEVEVTITPGIAPLATGYIVCRNKKDVTTGDDQREMIRIADSGAATTVWEDQNDEYPGTAEILMLTSEGFTPTYQWVSFMDLMRFDLGRVRASQPFLEVWYGTPDLKIARQNALLKNLGHADVDGWF